MSHWTIKPQYTRRISIGSPATAICRYYVSFFASSIALETWLWKRISLTTWQNITPTQLSTSLKGVQKKYNVCSGRQKITTAADRPTHYIAPHMIHVFMNKKGKIVVIYRTCSNTHNKLIHICYTTKLCWVFTHSDTRFQKILFRGPKTPLSCGRTAETVKKKTLLVSPKNVAVLTGHQPRAGMTR